MIATKDYSLARLLASEINHDPEAAAFERNVSEAISDTLTTPDGRQVADRHGLFIPMAAGLETGTDTAGGYSVFERNGGFNGALRPRLTLARLGATVLTGLPPTLRITRQTGTGSFTWVDENPGSDLSESDMTFGESVLTARTGASTTAVSRQLLRQGSPAVDGIIRRDLEAIAGAGIEQAAIQGSGEDNEPTGLLNTDDIGDVAIGANGGAPTYSEIIELEEKVGNADADLQALGFLTTPTMRRKLRETEKASGSGFVWENDGLLGYPSETSTLVPDDLTKGTSTEVCHAIMFGDWSRLFIALYALEVVVDPFTKARQGMVELTLFAHVGIGVSHPAAFAAILDATDV